MIIWEIWTGGGVGTRAVVGMSNVFLGSLANLELLRSKVTRRAIVYRGAEIGRLGVDTRKKSVVLKSLPLER